MSAVRWSRITLLLFGCLDSPVGRSSLWRRIRRGFHSVTSSSYDLPLTTPATDIGVNFIRHSQASGFNDNHFHEKRWVHHCSKFRKTSVGQSRITWLAEPICLLKKTLFFFLHIQRKWWRSRLLFRWFSFRISAGTAAILRFFMTLKFAAQDYRINGRNM